MNTKQYNQVKSWLAILIGLIIFLASNEIIGMFVIVVAAYFRDFKFEIRHYQKHENSNSIIKKLKYVTFALAGVFLIYTLYRVVADNPVSPESPLIIWAVIIVLTPLVIALLLHEYYLYKEYAK